MQLPDKYETAHLGASEYQKPASLVHLLESRLQGVYDSVLELGCGQVTILDSLNLKSGLSIDISQAAITKAQINFPNYKFKVLDVFDLNTTNQSFDLIVDSHLIHCLESLDKVDEYLRLIHSLLNTGGEFVIETMVASKGLKSRFGDHYFEIIRHEFERLVFDHLWLEELVKKIGFRINYLSVPFGKKMFLNPRDFESSMENPDVMQMILSL